MTRRYAPRMIPVDHEGTRRAEQYREEVKPVPTPREPAKPAAWEAQPEQPPTAPPKTGIGRAVRVVVPQPEGAVVMNPDDARTVKRMFQLARETTTDPDTRARLRRAEAQLNAKTRGAL